MVHILRNGIPLHFALCAAAFLVLYAYSGFAQERVELVQNLGSQGYILVIDGKRYQAFPASNPRDTLIAFTKEQLKRFLNRDDSLSISLAAERKRLAARDSLLAQTERTLAACVSNARAQDTLLQTTATLYRGYKDLYHELKRNFSEPWLAGCAGVGAMRESGTDAAYVPAFLLGVSIYKFGLWGFISSEQSGFLIGINTPISLSLF